jgi:hypothetical protein
MVTFAPSNGLDRDLGTQDSQDSGHTRPAARQQPYDALSNTIGLDAYVKPAHQRGQERRANGSTVDASASVSGEGDENDEGVPTLVDSHELALDTAATQSETTTCPVCGAFDGDAAAVAHHVSSHFDD